MQIQDMRALRSLRSSSLLFNLTKYNLNSPFTLSLHKPHQNPQICLQFRPIHSITRKSSPQSPALENNPPNSSNSDPDPPQNPRTWSVFNTRTNDLVKPKATGESSEIEAEEAEIESNSPNWVPRVRSDSVSKGKFGGNGDVIGINRKKGKVRKYWVCSNCGRGTGQWWGSCRECNGVGTLKQFTVGNVDGKVNGFEVSENATQSWLPKEAVWDGPVRLTDVNRGINQMEWRMPLIGLFGAEVARVLGGGVVPGSLILVGGDPGVGKSTLMLQMAANIAESCVVGQSAPVLYVSGEESVEQIGNRADRMRIGTDELYLYSSTDIEDILAKIQLLSPRAVVIDSIQTVYLKGVTGSPGGLIQVKECTSALLRFSKKTNIPVLLVGHVNKAGELAGPRVLEHIVDVVLYMEGEKHSSHRLLRSVKNRFGSTDELGIFEMSESGLQGVANPSGMFLREQQPDSEHLAGLAVAAVIDGSRTFIIEVQALCVSGTSVARHVNGVPPSRADMIISVLMKQAGLKLDNNAVYLNVVSGASLSETAGDLAVAAAICSSFLEFPIPSNFAFIGEIDLAGELRMVPRIEKRASTLAKLGYKMCVVPKSAESCLAALDHEGMQIVGCKNMKEVIHKVFTKH